MTSYDFNLLISDGVGFFLMNTHYLHTLTCSVFYQVLVVDYSQTCFQGPR